MAPSRISDASDTRIGGCRRSFPQTTTGFVSALRDKREQLSPAAMRELCLRYWKPIYYYLRLACARSNEDAKDLTQTFLLHAFQDGSLSRYLRDRGSFRHYLKVLLRRYVLGQDRAMTRPKRGGGVKVLNLESLSPERVPAVEAEEAFDRAWATALAR